MNLLNVDHIPSISLAYFVFLLITTLLGIASSIYSRVIFQRLCVCVMLLQGLVTLFQPSFALPRSPNSVNLDGLHMLMSRGVGCYEIFYGCVLWLTHKGHDCTPRVSLIWSWTVSLILKVLARVYLFRKMPTNSSALYTEQELFDYTSFAVDLTWIILLSAHLGTTHSWGGYAGSANRTNAHLRLESLALMVAGLVTFAFPQWIVRDLSTLPRLDRYHVFVSQLYGAKLFTVGLMSGRAVNYISGTTKATFMAGRVIFSACLVLLTIYSRLTSDLLATRTIYIHAFALVCIALNSAAGYASVAFPSLFHRAHNKMS